MFEGSHRLRRQYSCGLEAIDSHLSCRRFLYRPAASANITNDPQFVDLTATNLRLKSTSPCIDAGTNLAWMAGTTDLDGLPRIINGTADMGAYESPSPAITCITPPSPSSGPAITWASFTGAQYAVYGSTNFTYGYDILLQDGISALPPANSYTDTASGVALRGYAVGFEGKNGAE